MVKNGILTNQKVEEVSNDNKKKMSIRYLADLKKTEEEFQKLNKSIIELRESITELNSSNKLYLRALIGFTSILLALGFIQIFFVGGKPAEGVIEMLGFLLFIAVLLIIGGQLLISRIEVILRNKLKNSKR